MELTHAAVNGRIADLNDLASELRLERTRNGRPSDIRGPRQRPRALARPTAALGRWLVEIGTSLGGRSVERVQPAVR